MAFDLILEDTRDFSLLQSPDTQIMDTGASNDDTAHKMSKDKPSSTIMGISGEAVKNRYLCNILGIFLQHDGSRIDEGHYNW